MKDEHLSNLKEKISRQKKIIKESNSIFNSLNKAKDPEEKNIISSHAARLKDSLKKTNEDIGEGLGKISLARSLNKKDEKISVKANLKSGKRKIPKEMELSRLEKETLKRLRKRREKVVEKKVKKPSKYIKTASSFFSKTARTLLKKKSFESIQRDLIKTNLDFTPQSYISTLLFTTALSLIISFVIFLFLLFFNISPELPIITFAGENIGVRFMEIFWILFLIPAGTFLFMYIYPSLERKSTEYKIDQELPFATIHMAAISESRLEPSKIFSIIVSTREYPYIEKEFTKLINEINIYGYDLVTAMRNTALKTSSKKLTELLNSLATTINSGGDLPTFFEKRAQSLLFDYRLEREKYTKTAETFMDIYISVVIAAPMILMLLLMMMQISGLGVSLSSSMITLVMVLGVSLINVVFLTFLHLKQPGG